MGSKTNTQTTSSGPPPNVAQAYNDLLSRAQSVGSTPYQQYSGNLLAPFSGSQQQAFNTIDQSQGIAQPYINQAQQYATQGAAPITGQQIGQYLNPYTQDVINATQANFNEGNAQQQAQVRGNAIQQGALGNSRTGVAQAELARQQQLSQAPVIAGLESQGYNTALSAAQQDAARQGQAAYTFGNLGQEAQGTTLTGAQAQLTSGGLQQQQAQAGLNIPYQQWLQQQAFPYQQTGWLAGLETGVGSNLGGTSTTTSPGPNPLTQLAGLGIAGAGAAGNLGWAPFAAAAARGGAIKGYAEGGAPQGISGIPYAGAQSWIPGAQIAHGLGPPRPPGQMADPNAAANKMVSGAMDLAKKMRGNNGIGSPLDLAPTGVDTMGGGVNLSDPNTFVGPTMDAPAGLGGLYRRGGMVAYGGAVLPHENGIFMPKGYAEGGMPELPIVDRISQSFRDADAAIADGTMDPQGANQGHPVLGYSGNVPLPRTRPDDAGIAIANAAPVSSGIASDLNPDTQTLAYSGDTVSPGIAPAQQPQGQSWNDKFHAIAPALMAAGFGMMASRSPFLGTAIGEGGLAGVNAYNQQKRLEQEQANEEKKSAQGEERIQQESKRLDQAAKQAAEHLKLQTQQFAEQQQQHVIEKTKPVKIGVDKMGNDIMGTYDPASGSYKPVNASNAAPSATSAPTTEGSAPPIEVRAQAAPASPQARDESYLATLAKQDPGYAANIKAIADYQSSPNIFSRRNNRYEKAMADVYQYDPTYDSRRYNQTNKAIQSFATGKQGDAVRSFNVAIEHLGTAEELGKALENGDTQALNSVKNAIKTQFGYDAPPSFETAKTIVADEIAKAVIGGQNAEGDRRDLQKRLSASSSPSQLAGVIKTFKTLMAGQVIGYKKQYEDTTGLKNFDDRLTPRTRAELERVGNQGAQADEATPVGTRKQFKQGWGVWNGTTWVPEKP